MAPYSSQRKQERQDPADRRSIAASVTGYWPDRCAAQVLPVGPCRGYLWQETRDLRCSDEVVSSHEIRGSSSLDGSLPFDPQATAVWICWTTSTVGIPGSVGIVD